MAWPPVDAAPDAALTRTFAACLPGHRLTGPLLAYRSVDSTQAVARRWALTGAPEGAVVLADYQTAGRGQRGRGWIAPARAALLCSGVLRPDLPMGRWPEIPLMAGCAIAEGLEAAGPLAVELKWPNDVLIGPWKVAGVLAEGVASSPGLVVLGVGVNVTQ